MNSLQNLASFSEANVFGGYDLATEQLLDTQLTADTGLDTTQLQDLSGDYELATEKLEAELVASAAVLNRRRSEARTVFNQKLARARNIKDASSRIKAIQAAHKWYNARLQTINRGYMTLSESEELTTESTLDTTPLEDLSADDALVTEQLETELMASASVIIQRRNYARAEFNRRLDRARTIKDVHARVKAIQAAHKWYHARLSAINRGYMALAESSELATESILDTAHLEDLSADDDVVMEGLQTELVANAAVLAKKRKAAHAEFRRRLAVAKKVKNAKQRGAAVQRVNKWYADRKRAIASGRLALVEQEEFASEELSMQEMIDLEFLEEDLIAAAETVAQKQSALYKRYRQQLRDAKKIKNTADRVKKTKQIEAWYQQEKGKIAAGRLVMADVADATDLEPSTDDFLI